jgi:hypothetical protein
VKAQRAAPWLPARAATPRCLNANHPHFTAIGQRHRVAIHDTDNPHMLALLKRTGGGGHRLRDKRKRQDEKEETTRQPHMR